ncbi:MAG: DUF411 domain-containing protein [Prochlorococcaceae cyanobacterium]
MRSDPSASSSAGRRTPRGHRLALALAALLATAGLAALGARQLRPAPAAPLLVNAYRSASCGCCKGWLDHLKAAGFTVTDHVVEDLAAVKHTHRVPAELSSCHTATVAGYVIEGHVPATAIRKLLQQRPAVAGLAVPGMPLGSPGMESPLRSEPYTVFSFTGDGVARPFQRMGA